MYRWHSVMHVLLYSNKNKTDNVSVQVLSLMAAVAQSRCGICNEPFTFSLTETREFDHMVQLDAKHYHDDSFREARKTTDPAKLLARQLIPPEMKYTCAVHAECNRAAGFAWRRGAKK